MSLYRIGGWVWDNQELVEPSGVVRAFNVGTGALVWAWDLGNPAITKLPPDGQSYTRGTPKMWTAADGDNQLGIVYVQIGNSSVDYFGGNRKPYENT